MLPSFVGWIGDECQWIPLLLSAAIGLLGLLILGARGGSRVSSRTLRRVIALIALYLMPAVQIGANSILGDTEWSIQLVTFPLRMFLVLFFALVGFFLSDSYGRLKSINRGLEFSVLVMSLLAVEYYLSDGQTWLQDLYSHRQMGAGTRFGGPYIWPYNTAVFLVLVLLSNSLPAAAVPKKEARRMRAFAFLAFALLVAGQSRSAWIAYALLVASWFLVRIWKVDFNPQRLSRDYLTRWTLLFVLLSASVLVWHSDQIVSFVSYGVRQGFGFESLSANRLEQIAHGYRLLSESVLSVLFGVGVRAPYVESGFNYVLMFGVGGFMLYFIGPLCILLLHPRPSRPPCTAIEVAFGYQIVALRLWGLFILFMMISTNILTHARFIPIYGILIGYLLRIRDGEGGNVVNSRSSHKSSRESERNEI